MSTPITTPDSPKLAFLGLGAMGFGMATNLLPTFPHTTGYDIWSPTLSRFAAAGGITASRPQDAVRGARYVVVMVATAGQVGEVLFGDGDGVDEDAEDGKKEGAASEFLERGAVLILCCTGPQGYSEVIKKRLEGIGRGDVKVVDAPVSGGAGRAADGTLSVFASGDVEDAREVLDVMAGNHLHIIRGGLGMGTKVKMVHQVLAGIGIVMASEAMGFAARLGVNTKLAYESLKEGEGASWMFGDRAARMIVQEEALKSAVDIIVKDVGIVTAGGRTENLPLFLSSVTEQVLATGVSAGLGRQDDSQLTRVYLPSTPNLVLEQASAPTSDADDQKIKLVRQAMSAVHLAGTAEALALGKKVGLDAQQLYGIISTAAGTSTMFVERAPLITAGKWLANKTVAEVIAELVGSSPGPCSGQDAENWHLLMRGQTESLEEANRLKYPLHLMGTALQSFQLAAFRGHGEDGDVAVAKIWER